MLLVQISLKGLTLGHVKSDVFIPLSPKDFFVLTLPCLPFYFFFVCRTTNENQSRPKMVCIAIALVPIVFPVRLVMSQLYPVDMVPSPQTGQH